MQKDSKIFQKCPSKRPKQISLFLTKSVLRKKSAKLRIGSNQELNSKLDLTKLTFYEELGFGQF